MRSLQKCSMEAIQKSKQAYNNAMTDGRAIYNLMAEDPEKGLALASTLVESMQDHSRLNASAVSLACTAVPNNAQDEALRHSLNVAAISMVLGRDFGLTPDDLTPMGLGALLLGLRTEAMDKLPPLSDSASEVIQNCRKESTESTTTQETKNSPTAVGTEIVLVVQTYDALTNSTKNDGPSTPTDALSPSTRRRPTGGRARSQRH